MENVLLVEDTQSIVDALMPNLRLNHFDVAHVSTVREAKKKLLEKSFALAILDINLPDGNGIELCREIHEAFPELPIIVLTARTEEEMVVEGLGAGALDFVKKPFSLQEFMARVRRCMNRHVQKSQEIRFSGLVMDVGTRSAVYKQSPLSLTKREFDLLALLVKRAGAAVTRDEILRLLDDEGELVDRTVDSHISHLRKRLKDIAGTRLKISSVYGVGYKLEDAG